MLLLLLVVSKELTVRLLLKGKARLLDVATITTRCCYYCCAMLLVETLLVASNCHYEHDFLAGLVGRTHPLMAETEMLLPNHCQALVVHRLLSVHVTELQDLPS
jgi:hypothetical protein